jgi:molybdenum cofactor biosynthesis protein B
VTGTSVKDHRAAGPRSIRCFILTISDTRTPATDTSGDAIATLLVNAGHTLVGRLIVRDDPDVVRRIIQEQVATAPRTGPQVIITSGGTGISQRDQTFEAIAALLDKTLDGFGELFRMLSFQEIGPAAMMSRAVAGVISGRIVACLPGSEAAVRLAMERLLLPELAHLVQQVRPPK